MSSQQGRTKKSGYQLKVIDTGKALCGWGVSQIALERKVSLLCLVYRLFQLSGQQDTLSLDSYVVLARLSTQRTPSPDPAGPYYRGVSEKALPQGPTNTFSRSSSTLSFWQLISGFAEVLTSLLCWIAGDGNERNGRMESPLEKRRWWCCETENYHDAIHCHTADGKSGKEAMLMSKSQKYCICKLECIHSKE